MKQIKDWSLSEWIGKVLEVLECRTGIFYLSFEKNSSYAILKIDCIATVKEEIKIFISVEET